MIKIDHVLIAGAGLSGPALALSLARRGISSTIFEIRPAPSNAGGSITLTSAAIKALDRSTGIYPKLKHIGHSYTRMGAYSGDGYCYGEIIVGSEEDGEYAALRIMRSQLQSVLLNACEESADLVRIRWGVECTGIEESDDAVMASFSDGSILRGGLPELQIQHSYQQAMC